jgi:hypothetical protein
MHSPLILPVARRSISSESFSPCRPPTIIDVQDIRPRDSTPVYKSSPTIFFFKASSLDLSHHATSRFNHANRSFFVPILALRWNPGKNWLRQRRDAVAKKGDRGVLGKEGIAEPDIKGEDGRAPQGKLSNPMDGDARPGRGAQDQGSRNALCALPSYTSGIQEMDPPASSRPRKISNFRNFIILATPHRITTA